MAVKKVVEDSDDFDDITNFDNSFMRDGGEGFAKAETDTGGAAKAGGEGGAAKAGGEYGVAKASGDGAVMKGGASAIAKAGDGAAAGKGVEMV